MPVIKSPITRGARSLLSLPEGSESTDWCSCILVFPQDVREYVHLPKMFDMVASGLHNVTFDRLKYKNSEKMGQSYMCVSLPG